MAETFQTFIASERERLTNEREAIFNKQHELETKLAEINREFAAIEAYESAKTGKAAPARQAGTRRAPQARRGSKRDGILRVIKENPAGLSRGEILGKMGLKGNKSGEMSVSNALTRTDKDPSGRAEGWKIRRGMTPYRAEAVTRVALGPRLDRREVVADRREIEQPDRLVFAVQRRNSIERNPILRNWISL